MKEISQSVKIMFCSIDQPSDQCEFFFVFFYYFLL